VLGSFPCYAAKAMNLVIVGGGEIGSQIAAALCPTHNVTVLDVEAEIEHDFKTLDVQFVRGNGADPDDLRRAEVHKADAFVACTTNDDINVLSCLAAKGLGAKETLAFVTRQRYLDAFAPKGAMQSVGLVIDRVLWPQRTLALQIADIIRVPRALDSTYFANRRIKMVEYKLVHNDPFIGKPLADIEMPRSVLVVGAIREEHFMVPSGQTVLQPGDKVIFMGTTQSVQALEDRFAPKKRTANVFIIGGGNVGYMVAEQLHSDRVYITVVEHDEARCEKLAGHLPKALVIHGDGSDIELLQQERIQDADVVVAVTNDDGKNLLVSLMAKNLGVPKIITRVGRAKNRTLFERVGLDIALTPRTSAVQEVINWLQLDNVDHLASIEGRAEVMEVLYPHQCQVGRIRDLGAPPNSLIGAILHKDSIIIPHGDTTIQHGDHLLIITTPDNIWAVNQWLNRQKAA
jgi:trk system potassium uptake protein